MDTFTQSKMAAPSSLPPMPTYTYLGIEDFLDQAPVSVEMGINLTKTLVNSHGFQPQHQVTFADPVQIQPMRLTTDTVPEMANFPSNDILSIGKDGVIDPDDPPPQQTMSQVNAEEDPTLPESHHITSANPRRSPTVLSLPKGTTSIPRDSKSAARSTPDKTMCPQCGKYLSNVSGNLSEHLRTHTGEKPFECRECGASFAAKANLKTHLRLHTGEKPYMCGLCGKTFAQSSHLPIHMRRHTGERPYECPECHRRFTAKTTLRNHLKGHRGDLSYKCKICLRGFVCKSWLQDHYKVHSNDKPFQCEKCGKSYKDKSYILKHKAQYCGNDGYKKRWLVPGVVKPKGRPPSIKKKSTKASQNQVKRPVGRPKGRRSRKSRRKRQKTAACKEALCSPVDEEIKNIFRDDNSKSPIEKKEVSNNCPSTEVEVPLKHIETKYGNATSGSKSRFVEDIPVHLSCDSSQISYDSLSVSVLSTTALSSLQQHSEDALTNAGVETQYKTTSDTHEFPLDLDLSDQSDILNYAQPENLSLNNFTQPENLSHHDTSAHNFSHSTLTHQQSSIVSDFSQQQPQNLSHSHHHPIHIKFTEPENLSFSQTSAFHQEHLKHSSNVPRILHPKSISQPQQPTINAVFSQPQNLSLHQGLSLQGTITHPVIHQQEQIVTHSDKLETQDILNLTTFQQPENLSLPQNLSISHDLTQPQNLSQPENLSQPQNLSQNHSFSSTSNFSFKFCDFLQPQNLSRSLNLAEPHNLSQPHNLTQPENLSLVSTNLTSEPAKDTSNNLQPQNLSLVQSSTSRTTNESSEPQNLSYSEAFSRTLISLPPNLSEPQNLSLSHNHVDTAVHQPQNLSQSLSLTEELRKMAESPHSLNLGYY